MRLGFFVLTLAATSLLADGPQFTADGTLTFPAHYREWIFLSAGLGMTYGNPTNHDPEFSNVFVSPAAYHGFLETGRWPEKTMFVLEIRQPVSHGSINKAGHFQGELIGVEAEVKDSARFPETWAYFSFTAAPGNPRSSARAIPKGSSCQTCHGQNGAVENTFVQFYPTLIEVARRHGTLKADHEGSAGRSAR